MRSARPLKTTATIERISGSLPGVADGTSDATSEWGRHGGAPSAAGASGGPSATADPLKEPSIHEGVPVPQHREKPEPFSARSPSHPDPDKQTRRISWAALLQRVFEIDALRCPHCGSTMRLIAAIEDPAVAQKILECLKLPARAPPLEPASGLDAAPDEEAGWDFDQRPTYEEP